MFDFSFAGQYRVQSRYSFAFSTLEGVWLKRECGLLSADQVNDALVSHSQLVGSARVALRPAIVTRRSGKFESEPDILYKHEFFVPVKGTSAMAENIIDVLKAVVNWHDREKFLRLLFYDDYYDVITTRLENLKLVVANEYYLHEAGHFLGYDVLNKYGDGYFSLGGKVAWSLIYLEELRADLHAFGFGVQLLAAEQAVKIFLYNLALRFGVHRQGIVTANIAPYGLVPYMLFCILREIGYLSVIWSHGQPVLTFSDATTDGILQVMRECAAIAESQMTAPELYTQDSMECALIAAAYVRQKLEDSNAVEEFSLLMRQPFSE
ncbi:hypothetical protein IQ268_12200 [Oculatella sp. LEGE 06141]|uniref:hypothetical protein n=1 Tax=Oculatella sp. LEGE 06141 TaxID=1828648 RepID=UPI00187E21F7|nr:hypothetical protein [Oculatella sp. LEGE 06141]MBE9179323.1 hypothetical protein [Oculatella sp. LEGE 06141]